MRPIILPLIALTLFAGVATAAESSAGANHHQRLQKSDADQDGKLDKDERQAAHTAQEERFKTNHPQLFEKVDANHDGKIDPAERKAAHAALEQRLKANHPKLFEKVDANHDGHLDASEMKTLLEMRRAHEQAGKNGKTTPIE